MKIPRTTLLCLALATGTIATPALAAPSEYDLKAQLNLLMQWWPGEYDNHEQVVRQSGGGLSPIIDKPFHRVHSRYERVTDASLGEHVIKMVDNLNDDASQPLRMRTYVISVDKAAGALRLAQYAPKDATSKELVPLGPGCDISLRYLGTQFEGGMVPKSCKVGGKVEDYGLVIGPRVNWFREQPGNDWFEQTRARRFTCVVHQTADGIMRNTKYLTTVHLHDQGGEADIKWPDGRTLTYTIHNRAFSWPADHEYPLFRIHEKGKIEPIAYAYAADDATRFGLNLGWFYTRCYADGVDMGADAPYK